MIVAKIEKLIRKLMGEQAQACLAKVEKVYTQADKYCAECRQLANTGEETDTVYTEVAIPKLWGTENGGIWMTPSKGAVVLLNFLGGDRNYPIIAAVLGCSHGGERAERTGGASARPCEIEHPENELIIKMGETEIRIADKLVLKNASASLGALLGDIASLSAELKTIGAPSPHSLSPDLIAKWEVLGQRVEGLFKE